MKNIHTSSAARKTENGRTKEWLVSAFLKKTGMPVKKKREVKFDALVIQTKGWKFNREEAVIWRPH